MSSLARPARIISGSALLGVAALHAAWGAGSSWPMSDRAGLVEAVVGSGNPRALDDPAASYAVAVTLGLAAATVAGPPGLPGPARRVAVAGVAAALAGRAALGLAGRTDLVSPRSTGRRFRRLDRRVYSPACLCLAALTALSLADGSASRPHGSRGSGGPAAVSGVPRARTSWAREDTPSLGKMRYR